MSNMTTAHEGRTYNLTADTQHLPALEVELKSRGFDGVTYYGNSEPTGRQRVAKSGIFYRSIKSGEFFFVI
jgi:hypothetical protein